MVYHVLVMLVMLFKCLRSRHSQQVEILYFNETIDASWDSIDNNNFTINNEGCVIPRTDPLNPSIKRFVYYPTNLTSCHGSEHPLLDNNQTHIWVVENNFQFYQITNKREYVCCYRAFYRPLSAAGLAPKYVDKRLKYLDCIIFNEHIAVMNEFVRVTCKYKGRKMYDQFFLYTPVKPFTNYRDQPLENPSSKAAYNVIIMGLDTISRMNFYRTMPRTLNVLKQKGSFELFGYNKVGDNTFPNIMSVLVGMNTSELKSTCWPNENTTFDRCPFIWERFKDAGYYTALLEDTAHLGIFNYFKFGFKSSPTDYYLYPFIYESEKTLKDKRRALCMGNKYYYRVILDYVTSLTTTLNSSKLFGLFWETTMSHDYLNFPMVMDNDYKKFLHTLDRTGYLNKTILIIMSDHGMRYGGITHTEQGRLESRLPFVHVLAPLEFRNKYTLAFENLIINSRRLSTPYDIHATLVDLIDLNAIENEEILRRNDRPHSNARGISLFLTIPKNRTCTSAGISDHWCSCYQTKQISVKSRNIRVASQFLVRYLNGLLRPYSQCAILVLDKIIDAMVKLYTHRNNNELNIIVVVRVKPSGGVFEGTLRYNGHTWELLDSVSRLNLYGKQSRCINDHQLKLYCYCG